VSVTASVQEEGVEIRQWKVSEKQEVEGEYPDKDIGKSRSALIRSCIISLIPSDIQNRVKICVLEGLGLKSAKDGVYTLVSSLSYSCNELLIFKIKPLFPVSAAWLLSLAAVSSICYCFFHWVKDPFNL